MLTMFGMVVGGLVCWDFQTKQSLEFKQNDEKTAHTISHCTAVSQEQESGKRKRCCSGHRLTETSQSKIRKISSGNTGIMH